MAPTTTVRTRYLGQNPGYSLLNSPRPASGAKTTGFTMAMNRHIDFRATGAANKNTVAVRSVRI
jgi:hypothetical protein